MALNTIPNTGLTNRGYPSDRLVTPIIINGDMSVAQRGTSFTGQTSGAYYNDRFKTGISGLGTWTISQVTDAPTGQGLVKSQKFDCTTADASPSVGDFLLYLQPIEGQNLQMLKKGTSNAESLTLSFWVKSNKTGTYISRLYDVDNQRVISKSYTISSASTWEKKTLTFAGDTSGTLDNDNGFSFAVEWCLGAGSNYTSGTLNESWNSVTNANQFVGQVNLADSTSNEWYITGVQLEVGEFDSTTLPNFPFESFDNNLRKCQRYFRIVTSAFGTVYASNAIRFSPSFDEMRSTPSVSGTANSLFTNNSADFGISSGANYSLFNSDKYGGRLQISGWSGLSAGNVAQLLPSGTNAGKVYFDAEL